MTPFAERISMVRGITALQSRIVRYPSSAIDVTSVRSSLNSMAPCSRTSKRDVPSLHDICQVPADSRNEPGAGGAGGGGGTGAVRGAGGAGGATGGAPMECAGAGGGTGSGGAAGTQAVRGAGGTGGAAGTQAVAGAGGKG